MVHTPHAHLVRFNALDTGHPRGHWSPVTASINWCERDYLESVWIAEFFNTFTNLLFFYLSAKGIANVRRQGLDLRYLLGWVGLGVVGVGSFAFHATLQWKWQLADELPMLLVASQLCYISLETSRKGRSPRFSFYLPAFLAILVTTICTAYILYPNALLHQGAYGCLVITSTSHTAYLLKTKLDSTPLESIRSKDIAGYYKMGVVSSLLGFAIWNFDNLFCNSIQPYKDALGFPLYGLLEGHAWWHLLTGFGAYYLIFAIQLLSCSLREGAEEWEAPKGLIPTIERAKMSRKQS